MIDICADSEICVQNKNKKVPYTHIGQGSFCVCAQPMRDGIAL